MSAVEPVSSNGSNFLFNSFDSDHCPTCEQPIPTERLAVVKGRQAAQKLELERQLTASIAAQFEQVRANDQAEAAEELNATKQAAAQQIAKTLEEAATNEQRIRADMEKSFAENLNAQLAQLQQSHAVALQQLDTANELKLNEVNRNREETERVLKDQLNAAQAERAILVETARIASAQVEQITLESQQAQERQRTELEKLFQQRLDAQLEAQKQERNESERELLGKVQQVELERDRHKSALLEKTVELERARIEAVQTAEAAVEAERTFLTRQHHEQLEAAVAPLRLQIEQGEQAKAAAIEAALAEHRQREAATTEQLSQAQAKVVESEAAKSIVEEQLRNADVAKNAELAQQREVLEADKRSALLAEQAARFQEKQKLSGELDDLRRKLEQKTADELGEGAEIELFEELKKTFRDDLITEVPRGQQGADIIHEVRFNGIPVGKLIYDRKNRKDFKYEYATKLRTDQIAAQADHAILSTNKFPSGSKQLHIHDHVIIACPARVLALATLLREQVITMHTLRVSNEERAEKTLKLYSFITSPRFAQLIEAVDAQVTKLDEIDADERSKHEAVWIKRGKTVRAIAKATGDLRFEVSSIVGVLPAVVGEDAAG